MVVIFVVICSYMSVAKYKDIWVLLVLLFQWRIEWHKAHFTTEARLNHNWVFVLSLKYRNSTLTLEAQRGHGGNVQRPILKVSRTLNWVLVIGVVSLFSNLPSAFRRIASNFAFITSMIVVPFVCCCSSCRTLKAALDAILLNAEGGLKKRQSTAMTTIQFKALDTFFKMGLPTSLPCPLYASNVNVEFQ